MANINDDNKTNSQSMKRSIISNGMILGLFALVSTGLIVVTHLLTKDKIAKEIELSLVRQLTQIVASENYNNEVYQDCIIVNDHDLLGSKDDQKVYRMRNNGSNFGLMITTVAPDGYSGKINIALAISNEGNILGANILSHQETPGLGDKIERSKSDWVNQFNGLSLKQLDKKKWQVKKDGGQFDGLTGATITPRAVVKAVYKTLQFVELRNKELFSQTSNCSLPKDSVSESSVSKDSISESSVSKGSRSGNSNNGN